MKDGAFTADRLLALYDQVAEAEDAIPRLRRFVLDLAVRGKLVEQDPSDEPAAELLKRLGKGRVAAPDMPKNWLSAKLGEVIDLQYGKGLDKKLRLDEGPVPVFGSNGIVGFTEEPLTTRPSIVVGRKGSAGALNICDGPSWTTDVAYFVEVPSFLTLRYLFNLLSSLGLNGLGKGVKPGLSRSDAYDLSVSLPPLAEQQRIVAKVDELMALCDRLEAARAGREAVRDRLTAASLARLTAPEADAETFPTHARFALQTLPTLTTRPDQIKTLRQTILNLAVQGKLEPFAVEAGLTEKFQLLRERRNSACLNASEKIKVASEFELIEAQWREEPDAPRFVTTLCACHFITKGTTPAPNDLLKIGPVPFLKVYNIVDNKLDFAYRPTFISPAVHKGALARSIVRPGDVLMNIVGPPLGKVALVTDEYPEWNINQALAFFRPLPFFSSRFLALILTAPITIQEVLKDTRGTVGQDNLSLEQVRSLKVPFVSQAQQHRIVARVDALMALCDQLEASLTATTTTRSRLLDALLHAALGDIESTEAA